ncbi:MAG: oligosaccharide flippase family protein [Sinobacteraceae bacterium]|nr:oligosaccharide flippase family protein [Nevskiaceae bacterium]
MRTAKNAFWLTACRLSGDVLNLLLFILLSRSFGPAGVGEYSYAFAVATMGFVISCLGIEEYGIRQYARLSPQAQGPFMAELLGTQSVMLGIAVVALFIYILVTAPSAEKLAIVLELSCYQLTAATAMSLFIPQMASQNMARPALTEFLARSIACLCAAAALYFLAAPLEVALLSFPLAAVVWLLLAARSAHSDNRLRVTVTREGVQRIASIIWSFALIEIFVQLFSRVGVIVLSLAISDAAAGQFATGLRLIETALVPLGFFGLALYPRLSQLFATDRRRFRRTAAQMIWAMFLAGLVVAWGLYFVAPILLVPVLGERFASAEPLMQIMSVLALVTAIEAGLGRTLLSADKQVSRAIFIAVGGGVSLGLNVALVPLLDVDGAVLAGTGGYLVIIALSFWSLRNTLSARELVPLVATIIGCGPILFVVDSLVSGNGLGLLAEGLACGGVLLLLCCSAYMYCLRPYAKS